ncbi:hypothetical protein E2C01_087791 [Portunus trituberculatus]|uniref:Uncharacterized protein n=1 Tax=Portunus trituberculatus TaxID=210409 RepID=A0A5B7JHF5_PORTR|nr:hypothetical protein [Portunus trituberculatus]
MSYSYELWKKRILRKSEMERRDRVKVWRTWRWRGREREGRGGREGTGGPLSCFIRPIFPTSPSLFTASVRATPHSYPSPDASLSLPPQDLCVWTASAPTGVARKEASGVRDKVVRSRSHSEALEHGPLLADYLHPEGCRLGSFFVFLPLCVADDYNVAFSSQHRSCPSVSVRLCRSFYSGGRLESTGKAGLDIWMFACLPLSVCLSVGLPG